MSSAGRLVVASTSDDRGFSVPILVVAAAVAIAWLLLLVAVALLRRAPRLRAGSPTQDLPTEPPAVAGLLCDDFELRAEFAPATLLDLAARRVVRLEEVQPGRTICRLRREPKSEPLTPYEQRVLDAVARKAIDGVVPADALSTGTEDVSRGWHRAYDKEVITDAQGRGLTRDRWTSGLVGLLGLGPLAVGGLLYLASAIGGNTEGRNGVVAAVAGAVAVAAILMLLGAVGRLGRSLAQLPTQAGTAAATRCLALRAHLRENENLDDLPPAAVELWGRHFAYAGAMGVARTAVEQLPMGAEDDHLAWSRFGGRWRRVRVRYPRARPPAWGKHPGFALTLALLWGTVSAVALYGLVRVARDAGSSRVGVNPTLTRDQLDWIGRGALIVAVPFALMALWSLYVLVRAVPDFWARSEVTGDLVRARIREQVFKSGDDPKYWYYLALDDGTAAKIRAWRVRPEIYQAHSQANTVTAVVTRNLRYVREMRAAPHQ